MNIKVWSSFTKRRNSTLQPTGGTQVTAVLKESTSIENPSFILMTPIADYTYIEAFGHYYFVDDVINLDASRCEVVCSMDVLATFKSDITSYTAFVERSASSYDIWINDPLLSAQQKASDVEKASQSSTYLSGSGFVIQTMTRDDGISLYAMSDLTPFNHILTPSCYNATDVTEWINSKIAQAFDLDVYIGSVKWFPVNPGNIPLSNKINAGDPFYVGPVNVGLPASPDIYKSSQITTGSTEVYPALPTTNMFGDFRDCNPRFARYKMRLPGVGFVNLDSSLIGHVMNTSNLGIGIHMAIDFVTGGIAHTLYLRNTAPGQPENERPFARYLGNIGVDVPIGKSVADIGKSVGIFTGSIAGGLAVGGAAGAIMGAVVGAVEAIGNELTPDTSMTGGSGNKKDIAECSSAVQVIAERFDGKDYPTSVAGRPLMQNVQLSTLSGYVKCGNASVPLNAHASERDAVNNFLNSGFYIE